MYDLFKFEIVDGKYKIYYLGDSPMEVLFSVKIIGINVSVLSIKYTFTCKNMWFIPNIDYAGCSILSLFDITNNKQLFDKVIDNNLSYNVKKQNVVCIGLNKTGTSSFTSSMRKLGYSMFEESLLFQFVSPDVYHRNYNTMFSVLENCRYNLYNDMPFSFPKIYEKLYERRPDDIYVLTIRDNVELWIDSVIKFYPTILNNDFITDKSIMDTTFPNREIRFMLNQEAPLFDAWGITSNDDLRNKLKYVYEKHIDDVNNFFSKKSANFKIVNVSKENEFINFTKWMGINNDISNFDWVNKSS